MAAALEVQLPHLLGVGTSALSYSQLEACEEVHRELLSRLADARIELVRVQERTRAAEGAEIERLRATLVHATGAGK
jgi:LytS/YehU family sensor histidine kinase